MKKNFAGKVAAFAAFALLLLVGSAINARAQTTGTILGSVKDQSGAVLPGAEVTAKHTDTGTTRVVPANERGEYRIPALAVGAYTVEAKMTGFQVEVRSGITLVIGREAVIDFTLNVGNVAESVTITGEAPLLETTTAVVGSIVDSAQMRDIPLNGRSFLELATLAPGAVFAEAAESSATKGFGRKLAIGGQRYGSNSFLLDGADINDAAGGSGSAAGTMTGVETVREFRIITNAYDAEYGRHTGGVISAITKSGTNKVFGSLFGFVRNDNMDAAKWEENARGDGTKAEFRRGQFGGSVGGPIVTDKAFFFGSYEGTRELQGETSVFTVPSLALRNAVSAGTRNVVANVRPFWDAYPLPTSPIISAAGVIDPDRGDFADSAPTLINQNYYATKIDNRFNDNDSIFFRFTFDNADRDDPNFNTRETALTGSRYSTLEQTHIFSPAILGRTHFSFSRTNLRFFDLPRIDTDIFPEFLGRTLGSEPDVPGIIGVTTLTGFGGGSTNPKKHVQNTFQFKEDMTWLAGAHAFKFGGQFERFQFNQRSDFYPGGNFSFGSITDFMAGNAQTANFIRPGSSSIRGWRQNLFGMYLHDDWKLTSTLTLNIGVRYEIISVPTEANNKVATVRNMRPDFFYSFNESQIDVGDPLFTNPSLKNFAPRVGLAWSPFGSTKTSVRAGAGVFHDQILPNAYITSGVRMSPYFSVAEVDINRLRVALGPTAQFDFPNMFQTQNALLANNIGAAPQLDGFQWALEQPAVYKFSLDIERQVIGNLTVNAGYSGSRSTHLIRGAVMLNTNPSIDPGNGRARFINLTTTRLLNDNFGRMRWRITDATSDYHGFRLSVNKRFSQGFQFNSSYTFSKSTDDTSTWTGSTDFNESDRRGFLLDKDRGLSAFDVRRSWTNNFIMDLPGKGMTGPVGKVLGGWEMSGVIRMNDGFPLNASATQARVRPAGATADTTMRFVDGSSIDLIPGGIINSIDARNPDRYFDPAQFSYPATNCARDIVGSTNPKYQCNTSLPLGGYQGNVGRNAMTAPGSATLDINLMKETNIPAFGEEGALVFRTEFFNLLNRPNYGSPTTVVYDRNLVQRSDVGRIDSTRTSARQIQLAVRIVF
ncbi:MAG: TonB-dependent receptor [Acidobacteria bacterium]|nr:TonB-dependent receptor [Acidobacteriota bacterium]